MFNNRLGSSVAEKNKKKYSMHYLQQLDNFHEMQEMKAKNIAYRNEILKKQKIANYKNELDRITGEMPKSIFKKSRIT